MEDEGSGDRRRAAEALVSPPPRAKTVTIPEARDFIIPHAADQGRCSGFEVAEGTRPFLSVSLSLRRSRPAALDFSSLFSCGDRQRVRRRVRRRSDQPALAVASRARARCRTRRTTSGGAPRGTGSRRSSSSPPPRHRPRDLAPLMRWLLVRNAMPRRARPWAVGSRKRLEWLSTPPEISKKPHAAAAAAAAAHCPQSA